jgi:hypothetical protein
MDDSLSVTLRIPNEDAKIIHDIFNEEEEPRFILTSSKSWGIATEMEIYVDRSSDLLFLMKKVQRIITYESKRGKIPEIVRLEMENFKLKQEIEELKKQQTCK